MFIFDFMDDDINNFFTYHMNNKTASFVYVISQYRIQEKPLIKIGYSLEPLSRLGTLQSASPYELRFMVIMHGDLECERLLHKKFHHLCVSGEWFKGNEELIKYIDILKKRFGCDYTAPKKKINGLNSEIRQFNKLMEILERQKLFDKQLRKKWLHKNKK